MKLNKISSNKFALIVFLVLFNFNSTILKAQNTDSLWRDVDYIEHSSVWLKSGFATGLNQFRGKKISIAEIAYGKVSGGFINYFQAEKSETFSLSTQSIYRLNKKTVFKGNVSYNSFKGLNMQGSAWINPYQSPLGFEENADTTAGTKKLEQYHLSGAIAIDANSKCTIGAKLNYNAANYAKIKDMRHVNKLLDIDANLGTNYRIDKKNELAINLSYQRRIESLSFSISGNTDRQYLTLVNFGSFFGFSEMHSQNGFTAEENPMINFFKKTSFIYTHHFSKKATLLNEFSYAIRNGYFGKKSSTGIVYTEHDGNTYSYSSIFTHQKEQHLNSLQLSFSLNKLENKQNVFRRETATGGNSIIVYYGSNLILDQNSIEGKIEYASFCKLKGEAAKWVVKAGGNYSARDQTVTIYPYYRYQQINHFSIHAFTQRNFFSGKKKYAISLDALYGSGAGTLNDGKYNVSGATQPTPASRNIYLNKEYEFFTKPRLQETLSLEYAFINTNKSNAYLKLNYCFTKAFEVEYLKSDKHEFSILVGISF